MNAVCKTTVTGMALWLGATTQLAAQYHPSKYEIGLQAGTLIYQGDLASSRWGYGKDLKPAIGLSLTRHLDPYFSLRGNLTIGNLHADESKLRDPAYKPYRNFAFRTPVTELSALLVWNVPGNNQGQRLTYYFMGGAGVSFLRIRRDWSRLDRNFFDIKSQAVTGLATDTTKTTPRLLPVLPVGAGLRYQLSPAWSVHTEFIYRFTPTDYLDGFSRSVNADSKDKYYGVSVGISYRFGANRYRCPKVN